MIKSFIVKNYLNEILELELTNPEESGLAVQSVTGLGPGKSTVNIKEIASNDGGSFSGSRTPVRNIVMNLIFIDEYETIEDIRHKTYKYFPTKKPLTLTVVTDNHALDIEGIVESNEPDIFSNMEGCQISILCANPFFHTKREQITTSSGEEPMFEFPVDNELIENPEIENRVPSDEPYVTYINTKIVEYQNDNIKESPFMYGPRGDNNLASGQEVSCTVLDKSGKMPFPISYVSDGVNQNGSSGTFYLQFPWNKSVFKNDKKYTLSFLIDAEIDTIVYSRMTLDLVIYGPNGGIIFQTGEDSILLFERTPLACYQESPLYSTKTENRKIKIHLDGETIQNIYDMNLLKFEARGDFIYSNGSGFESDVIKGCDILIKDVVIYENSIEKRIGFSGEEPLVYKWDSDILLINDSDPYTHLSKASDILPFGHLIYDLDYLYGDTSWMPNPNDSNERKFVMIINIEGELYRDEDKPTVESALYLICKDDSGNESEMLFTLALGTLPETGIDYKKSVVTDYSFELTEQQYFDFLNASYMGGKELMFYINEQYKLNENWYDNHTNKKTNIKISNIRLYEILQPSKNPDIILPGSTYLIDKSMPNYSFTQNGIGYNLQASKGFIMAELQNYCFNHYVNYEGNKSIGFQMQIEFTNSLIKFGLTIDDPFIPVSKNSDSITTYDAVRPPEPPVEIETEDPGYIVIKSNMYPGKKMVIDLKKVKEILPEAEYMTPIKPMALTNEIDDNIDVILPGFVSVEAAQKGDIIFIDTRKKNKSVKYQKPNGIPDLALNYHWDYKDTKFNILPAINRDVEWFEISQGRNVFTIYHTMDPEKEVLTEEELEKCHADRLAVQIKNSVYYEGV